MDEARLVLCVDVLTLRPPNVLCSSATTCSGNEYYGWPEYALNYLTATIPGFNKNLWQHKVVIFDNEPVSW
jgi:hypothetical protein